LDALPRASQLLIVKKAKTSKQQDPPAAGTLYREKTKGSDGDGNPASTLSVING